MRLLVDPRGLAEHGRMALAARGLEARGHETLWLGRDVRGPVGPARREVDVLLGAGASPARRALLAWVGGAHAMALSVAEGERARWSALDRWCWGSLRAIAVAEPDPAAGEPAADEHADSTTWSSEAPPPAPDPGHPDVEILERACERMLSFRRGRGARPAVFLDRDGTLVVEKGYLSDPDDLELLPGVAGALRELRAAGMSLVVVSNQSGVGRGLFPASSVYAAMARLRRELRAQGVELDAVYFCPHRPDAGCRCRKPSPGLLEDAAANLGLSLEDSVMIGDKLLDAETGRRAGAAGILVRTGYGRDEERRLSIDAPPVPPDQLCDDLSAAARCWLERDASRPPRSRVPSSRR